MPPALGLLIGVLAVSSAAVLIRLAEAPPLTVGAWRLLVAAAVLVPLALWRERSSLARLTRSDLLAAGASAAMLALHFASWIASLQYTSVASSTVIVTSNPLLTALATPFVTRDPLSRAAVAGVLVALTGGAVIGAGDLRLGGTAAFGNLLALAGAAAASGYYLAGRRLRARLPVLTYAALVYPVAALLLTLAALAAGSPLTGFSAQTVTVLVLLGLLPQVVGHTFLNWALGHLPAVSVSAAVMAEPVGATLLALALLSEIPTPAELLGGALILAGVAVTLFSSTAPPRS